MFIPDFTDTEQKLVSALLIKRYAKLVPLQLADSELQLDASSGDLTLCPTLYWNERGAHFVVSKVAEGRYRSLCSGQVISDTEIGCFAASCFS